MADPRFPYASPCCDDCWDIRHPDKPSYRLESGPAEVCVFCSLTTHSGIYINNSDLS